MNVIGLLLLLCLVCFVFLFSIYLAIKRCYPLKKRYGYNGGGVTELPTNTKEKTELPTNTKEKNPFLKVN